MNGAGEEAYFDSLFCAHSMRHRGVGNALLKAGLDRVQTLGFKKVSGKIIGSPEHCEYVAKMLDRLGFEVGECLEMGEGWWQATMLKNL